MKLKSTFLGVCGKHHVNRVFSEQVKGRIADLTDLYDHVLDRSDLEGHSKQLKDVNVAFATWGMPALTELEIRTYLPNLQALFYAAGTVQDFARPFMNCGVRIMSSWGANAVPVAEFAFSQIILANKGYFRCIAGAKQDYWEFREIIDSFPGSYNTRVGLLGAGMIGKLVIGLLKRCDLDIWVFDPFLSDEDAQALGVRKSTLQEIFTHCQTISNHIANNPQTVGMLNRELFENMLPNATFINTGRGAQVVEKDLCAALKSEPGRFALLDVTWPEPLDKDSELLLLDNVLLTPHIAGSMSREVERMGRYMLDEFVRYSTTGEMLYEVTREMLHTMA